MEEEDKENEEEFVKRAIWETLQESQHLSLEIALFDESSDVSNSSSVGLEIDTQEPSTSKTPRKKRKICEPMPKEIENMEADIEEQLDKKAMKSKLTTINVKNILRHVIGNQHVMAMVKQSMRETGDAGSSDEDCPYEPKLTRAKTKELLRTKASYPWSTLTPTKPPPISDTKKMIDAAMPDDEEDDEEYQPVEEEDLSDDEGASMASDLEPLTPQPTTPRKIADCSTQTTWTEDGLFRVPPIEQTDQPESESLESIGQRTRSKFSLSDTALETIEQSFIPPDITTDMYDLECDNEDWREFLSEFTQPLNSVVNDTVDDDEADPEYNILSDEEAGEREDHEELRADRAVKVSKKELNELISELMEFMEPSDDEGEAGNETFTNSLNNSLQSQGGQSSTPMRQGQSSLAPVPPCSFVSLQEQRESNPSNQAKVMLPPQTPSCTTPTSVPLLSPATPVQQGGEDGQFILPDGVACASQAGLVEVTVLPEQRKLLLQQMQQHVQLLAQSYMQSIVIPEMHCCALETKENLLSLRYLKGSSPNSAFYSSNLEDAIQAVNDWDEMLHEDNPDSIKMKLFIEEEKQRKADAKKKKVYFEARHSKLFLDLVGHSKAFIYPLLLPCQPFSSRCNVPRALSFTSAEQVLLVFGLEQFLPHIERNSELHSKKKLVTIKKVSDLISEFLLPAKTSKAIEVYIGSKKRSLTENIISKFFYKNEVPRTVHYVIDAKRLAPCEQPTELLPNIWKEHFNSQKHAS